MFLENVNDVAEASRQLKNQNIDSSYTTINDIGI